MKKIDSILVPVDFSSISANACRYALLFADRLAAEVHFVYGIPPASASADAGPFTINLLEDLRKDALSGMDDFINDVQSAIKDQLVRPPVIRSYIKVGDLSTVVRQHVESENISLVLMGTHGSRDGWDELLGTHTSSLLGRVACPLIVIPSECAFKPLKNICYATDLKHADAFQVDNLLTALLPFRPAVTFLHVRQEEEEPEFGLAALRKMFDRPASNLKTNFVSIKRDDVVAGLFTYARENEAEMVVMARPDRSWLARLFSKSHTRDAVKYASLPLMILSSADLIQ